MVLRTSMTFGYRGVTWGAVLSINAIQIIWSIALTGISAENELPLLP